MYIKQTIVLGALVILATACGTSSKTSTTATSSTSTSLSSTASTTATLTPVQISEWSVEFTPLQSVSDVRYAIDTKHTDTADFSSASLISLDQQSGGGACITSDAPLGTLSRVTDFSAYIASKHTAPGSIHIGSYYYFYTPETSSCSSNQAVQNLESLQSTDLQAALNTLQAISQK